MLSYRNRPYVDQLIYFDKLKIDYESCRSIGDERVFDNTFKKIKNKNKNKDIYEDTSGVVKFGDGITMMNDGLGILPENYNNVKESNENEVETEKAAISFEVDMDKNIKNKKIKRNKKRKIKREKRKETNRRDGSFKRNFKIDSVIKDSGNDFVEEIIESAYYPEYILYEINEDGIKVRKRFRELSNKIFRDDKILFLNNLNSLKDSEYNLVRCYAFSLIISRAAIQFKINDDHLSLLFQLIFGVLNPNYNSSFRLNPLKERFEKPYGIKRESGEGQKTNIWFSDIMDSVRRKSPEILDCFVNISKYTEGLSNDQASSILLWGSSTKHIFGMNSINMGVRLLISPENCKILSICIKSSGNNFNRPFAVLTEAICLQGMEEFDHGLEDKMKERLDPNLISSKTINFDETTLRRHVNEIIRSEMDLEKYESVDEDEMWEKRWSWCVNGSHNKNIEKYLDEWKISTTGRMFRRSAVENINFNPITNFKGNVYVGGSFKKEIGKSGRIIMSCDTQSYFAFSHLLAPVEKCWKNKRVLLDPGERGSALTADRVRKLKGKIGLMLDFDEFDQQHSLLAQEIVIDELCKIVNFNSEKRLKLTKSFYQMKLHCKGVALGYAKFSLMSGHRATTFINSVLNASYIKMAAPALWPRLDSLHTGDDIACGLDSYDQVAELVDSFGKYNMRMNPMKQSIGVVSREFLRICSNSQHSIGYLCRSIGRSISGNWETPNPLDPEQSLSTWVSMGRSLMNRSGSSDFIEYCSKSMNKTTNISLDVCVGLLKGQLGLGKGPVFETNGYWKGVKVTSKEIVVGDHNNIEEMITERGLKSYSTDDYLKNVATDIEMRVYHELGLSPKNYMIGASYVRNDFVKDLNRKVRKINVSPVIARKLIGNISFEQIKRVRKERTLFDLYPLLSFIKNKISEKQIKSLCVEARVSISATLESLERNKLGGNYIQGALSYADASSICHLENGFYVFVTYPCYV